MLRSNVKFHNFFADVNVSANGAHESVVVDDYQLVQCVLVFEVACWVEVQCVQKCWPGSEIWSFLRFLE